MAKKLVIVESPAKAKTIKKYLGTGYNVIASNGHVRDLPKSTLGVDCENGFEPHYIAIRGKGVLCAATMAATKDRAEEHTRSSTTGSSRVPPAHKRPRSRANAGDFAAIWVSGAATALV